MTEPTPAAPAANRLMTLPMIVRTTTVGQREVAGRAGRDRRPRTTMSQFAPSDDRADPVALLAEQEVIRTPQLLPLRHARMSVSPVTFYRGGAGIMTADLASMPNSGLVTQLCGDAHLSNFGMFAAPDRSVIFDINDFDETNPGPFEWDVLRLAASFVLAGRDLGLQQDTIAEAAAAAGSAYRGQMRMYAGMTDLAVWYDRVSVDVLAGWASAQGDPRAQRIIARSAGKARSRDAWSAVTKLTEIVDGQRRFRDLPPLLMRIPLTTHSRHRSTTSSSNTAPPCPVTGSPCSANTRSATSGTRLWVLAVWVSSHSSSCLRAEMKMTSLCCR